MLSYPADFPLVISHSHRISAACQIENPANGSVLASSDSLFLVGGSVTIDVGSSVRRTCRASLVDPTGTLTPRGPAGYSAPYGNELHLSRLTRVPGYVDPTTGDEWYRVPLGRFRIAEATVRDDGSQTVDVTGYDRSRMIARAQFSQPYIIAAGTNYVTAIVALVQDRIPWLTDQSINVLDTTQVTPLIVLQSEADPWAEIVKMATVIGMDAWFDGDGVFRLTSLDTSVNLSPVWTYTDGADSVVLDATKTASDDPGYSGVVVRSTSTTVAPVRSEIWDSNPDSPTYYLGAYGMVPRFIDSPYVVDQASADALALATLQDATGATEQLSIGIVPNPALEVNDPIRIIRSPLQVDQTVLIDQIEIPLAPTEPMRLDTRVKRAVS